MSDYLNKFVITPVSQFTTYLGRSNKTEKILETVIKHEYQKLEPFSNKQLPHVSRGFLKVAGLSGLSAVLLSAYGSHSKKLYRHCSQNYLFIYTFF